MRNVDERPAQDYILRKLEVTRLDRVGKAVHSIGVEPLTWVQIITHLTLNPPAHVYAYSTIDCMDLKNTRSGYRRNRKQKCIEPLKLGCFFY